MGVYIQNKNAIKAFLNDVAGKNAELARLLALTLHGPLQHHSPNLKEIKRPSPKWSETLTAKYNARGAQTWLKFEEDAWLERDVMHIRDWLQVAINNNADWLEQTDIKGRPTRLTQIRSLDEAREMAEEAFTLTDEAMRSAQAKWAGYDEIENGDIEIIMNLEDGYKLVQMRTEKALHRETAFMGHCIGNPNSNIVHLARTRNNEQEWAYYSLRDPNNKPHATLEHNVRYNSLVQCRGKQNVPPLPKYQELLKPFIEHNKFEISDNLAQTGLTKQDETYWNIFDLPDDFKFKGNYIFAGIKKAPPLPREITGRVELSETGLAETNNLRIVGEQLHISDIDNKHGAIELAKILAVRSLILGLERVGRSIYIQNLRFSTLASAKSFVDQCTPPTFNPPPARSGPSDHQGPHP